MGMRRETGIGMYIGTLYNSIAWFNSKYSINITIT